MTRIAYFPESGVVAVENGSNDVYKVDVTGAFESDFTFQEVLDVQKFIELKLPRKTPSTPSPAADTPLPEEGQCITVTHRDGSTSTGRLTKPMIRGQYMGVKLDNRWAGYMPSPEESGLRVSHDSDVISWVEAKPEYPKLPENGQYITITRHDGQTATGEVKVGEVVEYDRGRFGGPFNILFIDGWPGSNHIHTEGECQHSDKYNSVVSWVAAERPKKIKWPKGATVQGKHNKNLFTLRNDVFEGDKSFLSVGFANNLSVEEFNRVEIKVVD